MFFFIPEERVATQPPTVLNSSESGSWPVVKPLSLSWAESGGVSGGTGEGRWGEGEEGVWGVRAVLCTIHLSTHLATSHAFKPQPTPFLSPTLILTPHPPSPHTFHLHTTHLPSAHRYTCCSMSCPIIPASTFTVRLLVSISRILS